MRVDDAGARTWLLSAVAGWGVLAWLLAVSGMGGRIAPLADDPGLIKPIPALPGSSANRLGPLAQYAEISARPLLAPDRHPSPFFLQGGDDSATAAPEFDYLLTSVLITPRLQLAILQSPDGSKSERVKVGAAPDAFPGWRLSTLDPRSAVFDGPSGPRTLELRVFDGTGGQPPTVIARDGQRPVGQPIAPPGEGQPVPYSPVNSPKQVSAAPVLMPGAPKAATDAQGSEQSAAEQSQMEAIRQRIQARRAQLRQQTQSPPSQPTQPPANSQ